MSTTAYTDDDSTLTMDEFSALNRLKAESIRRQLLRGRAHVLDQRASAFPGGEAEGGAAGAG